MENVNWSLSPSVSEAKTGKASFTEMFSKRNRAVSGVSDLSETALRWLLGPQDPSIRYQTLVDVLGYSDKSTEAVEARQRIPRQSIFKLIMAGRSKAGYWPRKDTCDGPRFTGALWALILLGEMAVLPDPRIRKECERFLDLHQAQNGSFSYRSRLQRKKHYDEPCLT